LLAPFGFYSTAYCSHTFAHRQRAAEHQKPTSITHNPLYEYTVRQGLNGERRVELDLEANPGEHDLIASQLVTCPRCTVRLGRDV